MMNATLSGYLKAAAANLERAATSGLDQTMEAAIEAMSSALAGGRAVLVCGNGGSQADAQHIAGELASRFLRDGKGLPVMALGANSAMLTAWSNDFAYETVFAREVEAYGAPGGVCLGISTSGNSKNVVKALEKARELSMRTIGLTGNGGGRIKEVADILLDVPETSTPRIQEMHICLYHYLCSRVEANCR